MSLFHHLRGRHARGRRALRRSPARILLAAVAGLTLISVSAPAVANAGSTDRLVRYPYLTDAQGGAVTVNWATDTSSDVSFVAWKAAQEGRQV